MTRFTPDGFIEPRIATPAERQAFAKAVQAAQALIDAWNESQKAAIEEKSPPSP